MSRRFTGGCHCRALHFRLDWPEDAGPLPARRCTCSYCTRFDGTWTSHPDARLELIESGETPAHRYRFGTGTADFLGCSRCGITVAALCDAGCGWQAVVNIHTLDDQDQIDFDHSDSDFEGESVEDRLGRRLDRWIGDVIMRVQT